MELLESPEVKALEQEYANLPAIARAVKVVDDASLLAANELLGRAKAGQRRLDELFDETNDKAYKSWKAGLALKKKLQAPFIEVENYFKPQIADYTLELERRQREAAEVEQRRLAKEKEDAETRLKEAADLEKAGFSEEARAAFESIPEPAAPVPVPTMPKLQGTQIRTVWKHRVVNPDLVPREFLLIDEARLAKYAQAMKDKAQVLGVEFFPTKQVVASGRGY